MLFTSFKGQGMSKRGLIVNTGSGDSATRRSYIDLHDNDNKALVDITDSDKTLTTIRTNNASLVEDRVCQREG